MPNSQSTLAGVQKSLARILQYFADHPAGDDGDELHDAFTVVETAALEGARDVEPPKLCKRVFMDVVCDGELPCETHPVEPPKGDGRSELRRVINALQGMVSTVERRRAHGVISDPWIVVGDKEGWTASALLAVLRASEGMGERGSDEHPSRACEQTTEHDGHLYRYATERVYSWCPGIKLASLVEPPALPGDEKWLPLALSSWADTRDAEMRQQSDSGVVPSSERLAKMHRTAWLRMAARTLKGAADERERVNQTPSPPSTQTAPVPHELDAAEKIIALLRELPTEKIDEAMRHGSVYGNLINRDQVYRAAFALGDVLAPEIRAALRASDAQGMPDA